MGDPGGHHVWDGARGDATECVVGDRGRHLYLHAGERHGVNAGLAQVLSVHFVPTDTANYNTPAPDTTVLINVHKATLTASIIGNPTKLYDTTTSATLTAANFALSGLVGSQSFTVTKTTGAYNSADVVSATTVSTSLIAGDFTAGAGTLASNYDFPASASGPGHIIKATPVVTWATPADITYGTASGATQLNASSGTVAGTFTYTPASGTVLNAGLAQVLSVHFVPTDTANYNTPAPDTTVHINVSKVALTASIIGNPSKPVRHDDDGHAHGGKLRLERAGGERQLHRHEGDGGL